MSPADVVHRTKHLAGALSPGRLAYLDLEDPWPHSPAPAWTVAAYGQFQRSPLEPDSQLVFLNTPSHFAWSAEHVLAEYADTIRRFLTQTLTLTTLELGLSVTSQRLTAVQQRLSIVESRQRESDARLAALEAATGAPYLLPGGEIPWERVESSVQQAALDLGWDARLQIERESKHVNVTVPADQEDLLVESSLAFYECLARNLGPSFRLLSFDLDVSD